MNRMLGWAAVALLSLALIACTTMHDSASVAQRPAQPIDKLGVVFVDSSNSPRKSENFGLVRQDDLQRWAVQMEMARHFFLRAGPSQLQKFFDLNGIGGVVTSAAPPSGPVQVPPGFDYVLTIRPSDAAVRRVETNAGVTIAETTLLHLAAELRSATGPAIWKGSFRYYYNPHERFTNCRPSWENAPKRWSNDCLLNSVLRRILARLQSDGMIALNGSEVVEPPPAEQPL